jgi:hypothetical protein
MIRRTTLLLISGNALIRADVEWHRDGPPVLVDVQRGNRPANDDPESLIDACLALGDGVPGTVWVLLAEGGMALVELPRTALERLPPVGLAQRLAVEVEPLTGLEAVDMRLGWHELPASGVNRRFWCVQMPSAWWTAASELFARRGQRLGGFVHPAGLAGPLPDEQAPWQRLEAWGPLLVQVVQETVGAKSVMLLGSTVEEVWRTLPGGTRVVLAPGQGAALDQGRGGQAIPADSWWRLDDLGQLRSWCLAAALTLVNANVQRPPPVPAILAPPRPLPVSLLVTAAALLWLVVVSACWLHWRWSEKATAATVPDPAVELKQIEDRIAVLEAGELTAKKHEQERRERSARAARILRAVGEAADPELIITRVRIASDHLDLGGGSVNSAAPIRFSAALEELLVPVGWRVQISELAATQAGWRFAVTAMDPANPTVAGPGGKGASAVAKPPTAAGGARR